MPFRPETCFYQGSTKGFIGDHTVSWYFETSPFSICCASIDLLTGDADHYAFLVNHKASLDLVLWRTKYYRLTFAAVLEALGVPVGKIHFVDCSSYEFRREFVIDNYKLLALASVQDAQDAGAEYRKPGAKISVLLCPGLQSLGEEYLDADFQFGGEDQVYSALQFLNSVGFIERTLTHRCI